MSIANLILDLLMGGGDDEPSRPMGPGLNPGEAPARRAAGLPTRARRVAYETSSGPGMGVNRINEIREREGRPQYGQKPAKKLPKKFPNKNFGPGDVKHGMAGLRGSMNLPTQGKNVKDYNRMMEMDLIGNPAWDSVDDVYRPEGMWQQPAQAGSEAGFGDENRWIKERYQGSQKPGSKPGLGDELDFLKHTFFGG